MQCQLKLAVVAGLGVATLHLAGAVADASTIREDRSDSLYIDLGSQFPAVGRTSLSTSGTGGTLVAPNVVLTAAHIGSPSSFFFDTTRYTVLERHVDPQYDPSNPAAGHDFQILILDEPVAGIDPVPLYLGSDEVGMEAVFVGWGDTGTGDTGATPGSGGTKRGFENVLDATGTIFQDGTDAVLVSDFDSPFTTDFNVLGSAIPLNLEGNVADIDSGGGLFIEVDGVTYLAGVAAFIADPFQTDPPDPDRTARGQYGELSGFSRVSSAQDFLVPFIPEPGTGIGGLLIGASALLRRRSRSIRS